MITRSFGHILLDGVSSAPVDLSRFSTSSLMSAKEEDRLRFGEVVRLCDNALDRF